MHKFVDTYDDLLTYIDSACLNRLINFSDRVDFEVSQRLGLRFYRSNSLYFSVAHFMYILAL